MTSPSDEVAGEECCTTCGQTRAWHEANNPRHEFNGPLRVEKPKVQAQAARWPFDPVLRQALMDKGVLTPEDLTAAETKIRAVSGMGGDQQQ